MQFPLIHGQPEEETVLFDSSPLKPCRMLPHRDLYSAGLGNGGPKKSYTHANIALTYRPQQRKDGTCLNAVIASVF